MPEQIQTTNKSTRKKYTIIMFIILLIIAVMIFNLSTAKKETILDSNDLEQTAFAATIDSNLPEHKNVIWCSTFQMAWDKLKNDIIKEPVKLIESQDLADQLNRSEFSPDNMDVNSYYTAAGFINDGIIDKVIADMAKRFPEEPAPIFSESYRILPEPVLAYAYLNANIPFKYSFYTYKKNFAFESSDGEKTNVTAFSSDIEEKERDSNYNKIQDQINVLYFEKGKDENSNYFVVDLCKYTEPYQVILALVPQKNNFQKMISDVEKKITAYKNYYWNWPEFNQSDKLIVPDVIAKITHDYKEFIMKNIGNEPWKSNGYFIFDAQQTIDFSLSKSGVVMKSQGKWGIAGGGDDPRYMYFNRPFMIYAQKREAGSKPFFVMWIDNAELMKKL
jgi:hypothetical protein